MDFLRNDEQQSMNHWKSMWNQQKKWEKTTKKLEKSEN